MKAIRISNGAPELVEVPAPDGDGVRVKVVSSSICGSDLHMIDMGLAEGSILGHEFAGLTPDGTAVAIEPVASCGRCPACEDGQRTHCAEGAVFLGIASDGGMAQEVVIAESMLVELPTGLDVSLGCLVEPIAVALHGINRARTSDTDRVLVIGAGPIGLAAAAVLQHRGIPCDIAARHPHQQAAAESLGASNAVGDGYDVVIDAVASTASISQGIGALKPRGRISLVGTLWEPAQLDVGLGMKEIEIIPAMTYSGNGADREFTQAAGIVAANPRIADAIITHRFPLDGAPEAFSTASDRAAGAIKVAFDV